MKYVHTATIMDCRVRANGGPLAITDHGTAIMSVVLETSVLLRNRGETERGLPIMSAHPVRGESPNWMSDAADLNSFG
jgi:hypothetical protein